MHKETAFLPQSTFSQIVARQIITTKAIIMFRRVLLLVSTLTFALLGAANAVASDFDDGNFDIKVSSDIGEFLAAESGFSPPLARWSDGSGALQGKTVYIGRGCTADAVFTGPDDPYLADPAGKVALIDRGACFFTTKVARAEAAGAIGVIVINLPGGSAPLGDFRVWMRPLVSNPPAVGIPAVSVGYSDGSALMAAPGVSVNLLYKPFTLLKGAIETAPTLLSDEEKDSLKKLVSDAARLATRSNPDFSQASELIVQFRDEMSERFFEGKISFDLAQSLFDSGFSLQYRLDTAP